MVNPGKWFTDHIKGFKKPRTKTKGVAIQVKAEVPIAVNLMHVSGYVVPSHDGIIVIEQTKHGITVDWEIKDG